MKRLYVVSFAVAAAFLMLLISFAAVPVRAAQTPPGTSTPTIDDLMAEAEHAVAVADRTTTQAGLVLNFIQVVAIIIGALGTLLGLGLGVTGLRTLNDYQAELGKARDELDTMRAQLTEATSQASQTKKELEADNRLQFKGLREQAASTYRALALLQLGEQQLDIGNISAALRIHEEAYQLDPDNRATNYLLGELYILERDLPKAVEHLERALAQDPNLAPAHAALGLARRLEADKMTDMSTRNQLYAEAEQRLIKAIQLDPTVRDANKQSIFSTLGALYRRQGRIGDAIHYYSEAEKRTPNSSYPIINLAQLHFMHGDVDEAKSYFKRALTFSLRALEGNPFDYWARFDVATARLALGETDEALEQLRLAINQQPGLGPLETLLSGLQNLKNAPHPAQNVDRAIEMVQEALRNKEAKKSG